MNVTIKDLIVNKEVRIVVAKNVTSKLSILREASRILMVEVMRLESHDS